MADENMFGDNGWWIVLLFILLGMGGGLGASNGAMDNYVLNSDFATIQRQMSDGFNSVERRTDSIINGLSELGYTEQSLINGVNMNVMQNGFNTQSAICSATREIVDSQNAGTRAILDAITTQTLEAKNEKIADLERQLSFANLQSSQAVQNEILIGRLNPSPVPAYMVANPNGCNCACGF